MKAFAFSALMAAAALAAGCDSAVKAAPAERVHNLRAQPPASAVDRGKYLVNAFGCSDCHTPKKMGKTGPELDTTRMLSGHPAGDAMPPAPALKGPWIAAASWDQTAWAGPWGVSYSVNLTPDKDTGLGHWTAKMFIDAMRTGKHMGASRPILPPMPWQSLATMTDNDLQAMFAYLQSLPPVSNRVPDPVFATQ